MAERCELRTDTVKAKKRTIRSQNTLPREKTRDFNGDGSL